MKENSPEEERQRLEDSLKQQRKLVSNLVGLAGMHVASSGSEVVANAETLEELLKKINEEEVDRVWRVPRHKRLMLGKTAVGQA
ncbi:hypothetical protein BVY00_01720 [bacterium G20]|nr:hypothetical protein BVY00_01720 [bacterium G20]